MVVAWRSGSSVFGGNQASVQGQATAGLVANGSWAERTEIEVELHAPIGSAPANPALWVNFHTPVYVGVWWEGDLAGSGGDAWVNRDDPIWLRWGHILWQPLNLQWSSDTGWGVTWRHRYEIDYQTSIAAGVSGSGSFTFAWQPDQTGSPPVVSLESTVTWRTLVVTP